MAYFWKRRPSFHIVVGLLHGSTTFNFGFCLALILDDQRAGHFGPALDHAGAAHVVPVAVAGLDEGVAAVRALVALLLPVRLLVVDHITKLGSLDMALEALEELVSPPSLFVHHVMFFKAHIAWIGPVSVANPLLNWLLEDGHALRRLAPRRGFLAREAVGPRDRGARTRCINSLVLRRKIIQRRLLNRNHRSWQAY